MTLAYFDSFAGLVPCRIVAVGDWSDKLSDARVQWTATRGPYKRGQFETWPLNRIVPRNAVRRRKYGNVIKSYNWTDYNARVLSRTY